MPGYRQLSFDGAALYLKFKAEHSKEGDHESYQAVPEIELMNGFADRRCESA